MQKRALMRLFSSLLFCFQLQSDLSDVTAHLGSLLITQLRMVGFEICAPEKPERTQPTILRC